MNKIRPVTLRQVVNATRAHADAPFHIGNELVLGVCISNVHAAPPLDRPFIRWLLSPRLSASAVMTQRPCSTSRMAQRAGEYSQSGGSTAKTQTDYPTRSSTMRASWVPSSADTKARTRSGWRESKGSPIPTSCSSTSWRLRLFL